MTTRRLLIRFIVGCVVCSLAQVGCMSTPEDPWDFTGADDDPIIITVATYNTHNLFDTECDSGECGVGEYEPEPTDADYAARIEEVADAIAELDADIVLLQEIEKEAVLQDIAGEFDGEYPVAVHGELGYPASLDVSVLSTGELVDWRGYRSARELERPDGSSTSFAREFLRVDLELGGKPVIAFSSHFRSKRDDDPGRRLAEAEAARDIVDEVARDYGDALVVMGGDLNDRPGSEPLEVLTGDEGLRRAGANRDEADLYTYVYDGDREAIDHLFNAPTDAGGYVAGSAASVHDRSPVGFGGSDHGAVVARYQLE